MSNYETKPLEVQAYQVTESNAKDVATQLGASSVAIRNNLKSGEVTIELVIPGEAPLTVSAIQWVVQHPEKGVLTMTDDAFQANYNSASGVNVTNQPAETPAEAPATDESVDGPNEAADTSGEPADGSTSETPVYDSVDHSDTYNGDAASN